MLTREIIFRGMDEDGKWIIGSLVQDDKGETRIFPRNYELNGVKVKSDTVQQFTGLYDKKRMPVYENDIVKVTTTANDKTFTETGIVRFDNLKVYVETANGDKPMSIYFSLDMELDVLGNEVTDAEKCLLQRIDNFLETFIPDDFEEFPETGEMYALIRDAQKLLKKQMGADNK